MKKLMLVAVLGLSAVATVTPRAAEGLLFRRAFDSVKRTVSSGASRVARTVSSGANAVGNAVREGAQRVGNAVKNGVRAVGNAVKRAVIAAKLFGAKAWGALKKTAEKVWTKTLGGAAAVLRFVSRAKSALKKAARYAKQGIAKAKSFMRTQTGRIQTHGGKLKDALKDARMKSVVKRLVSALMKGKKPNQAIMNDLRTLGTRLGLVKRHASLGRRGAQAACGSWKEFSPKGSWGLSIGVNLSAIVIGVQFSVGFMVDNDFKDARLFYVWTAGPATEVEASADLSLEFSRFKVSQAQGKGWGFNFGGAYKAGLSLGFEWAGDDLFDGNPVGAFEISPTGGVGAGANFYYFECKTT